MRPPVGFQTIAASLLCERGRVFLWTGRELPLRNGNLFGHDLLADGNSPEDSSFLHSREGKIYSY